PSSERCARAPCPLPARQLGQCSPSHPDFPGRPRLLSEMQPAHLSSRPAGIALCHNRSIAASLVSADQFWEKELSHSLAEQKGLLRFPQARLLAGQEFSPVSQKHPAVAR